MSFTPSRDVDDSRVAFDAERERCPVTRGADGSYMVTGHAEALACALSPHVLSNRVSSRLQIPNGLDGDEHRRYRTLVDGFFASSHIRALVPRFDVLASELVSSLPRAQVVDAVWDIGALVAVRCQSAWLGWPAELEPSLLQWMADYRAALRSDEAAARADVAHRFEQIVTAQIELARLRAARGRRDASTDLLEALLEDAQAPGGRRRLQTAEVVSILRNWTAGDLGTIAACLGVVVHRVALDVELQRALRENLENTRFVDDAIDECLRIDDPFLWNRRKATADFAVADELIAAGSSVVINWAAANRDPRRFPEPDAFSPQRNAAHNLVYGIGSHVCPGRELATVQLRAALSAMLRGARSIRLAGEATRARPPTGGYDRVPVLLAAT